MKIKVKGINGIYKTYSKESFTELLDFYESKGVTFFIDEWGIEAEINPSKQKNRQLV